MWLDLQVNKVMDDPALLTFLLYSTSTCISLWWRRNLCSIEWHYFRKWLTWPKRGYQIFVVLPWSYGLPKTRRLATDFSLPDIILLNLSKYHDATVLHWTLKRMNMTASQLLHDHWRNWRGSELMKKTGPHLSYISVLVFFWFSVGCWAPFS